jgi:hypothetical protein
MLSRIATAKAAEHASQAALESVARLKTSRAAGPALACKSAGIGKSGWALNCCPGGLTSTTRLVGLLSVHGRAGCPSLGWYAKEPHDKGENAVGFMVSTTTGTGGGVKGLMVLTVCE